MKQFRRKYPADTQSFISLKTTIRNMGGRLTGNGICGQLTLVAFSIVNLLFLHYYVYLHHHMEDVLLLYEFPVNFMTTIFDVSVVLMVSFLLTWGKQKVSLLLTYILTFVWALVNVFYVRFFGQYLSLSAISQIGNLTDQAVVNSLLSAFQWSDFFFVLSPLLFIWIFFHVRVAPVDKRVIAAVAALPVVSVCLIVLIYSAYHVLKPDFRGNTVLYKKQVSGLVLSHSGDAFPNKTRFAVGFVRILGGEIYDIFHQLELTEQQRADISREISDYSQRVTHYGVNPELKNVVFVLLESFLSSPIGLTINGKEITPFLNALKSEENVYYNGQVTPNITIGESGDGQFIYMTGLLPLRDKLTVGEAKKTVFPALPSLLKQQYGCKYSEIVMPSPPKMWEQESMNKIYGIDTMFCNRDLLGESVEYLNDEQVFTLAMRSPLHKKQPFFSMVLNYSTHQPYRSPVDDSFMLSDASLPEGYKNYLIACHYADRWLQKYFSFLKKQGVYDNTLIVIASDHHAHLDALGMGDKVTKDLPLFIVHGGIDKSKAWTGRMNQLDVFTTLTDVLGIACDWHGLGHTVLTKDYHNSLTESNWKMSGLIIRGRYFE